MSIGTADRAPDTGAVAGASTITTSSSCDRVTIGRASMDIVIAGARRATMGAPTVLKGAISGTLMELGAAKRSAARLFFGTCDRPAPNATLFQGAN